MGALMRAIDWSRTAVGPVEQWPQSLRTALSILLETGFPMYIAWGPDFTQFYNDGYRPILGSTKHPTAMGISTRDTFAEIWDIIGPMFEGVMRGTPVTVTDFLLPLDRHGFVEECYFVFSYSPIREESRRVGGVLVTVTETTERVFAARRLVTLQDLVAKAQNATTPADACAVAASVLTENSADVPWALIYLLEASGRTATLAGAAHLAPGSAASPATVDLDSDDAPWPIARVMATREAAVVAQPPGIRCAPLPEGTAPTTQVLVLPIAAPGADKSSGVLIAALSPRLLFDAKYRSFLELVASYVGSAIASARALEEAKARADALAEIDRAKTAFFSNVSHEFRTPLTLMLGPAEDALADTLSPEEHERWAIVHRSALRLAKLVNTLLDFSRIEAGRIEASYEPTNLAALTRELASMFRSAIDRCGVYLRLDVPEVEEDAYVDREMWEKIVLNLLSNALKFTFEGEISVALRVVGEDFELVVRDTGIGIAAADLPQMFDRFHRVKGARARTHEGTGIGLALVAELAKLHGGNARVESTEGRGTAFFVRVPRGRGHLPAERVGGARTLPSTSKGAAPYVEEALRWMSTGAAAPAALAPPDTRPGESAAKRARVLLADDNADMRDYLSRLLRERWDVEAVADGDSALAAIRREPPDLVLSDVMMPGLDGFGVLRAVRSDPALRVTPVILLSARAGEEATAEGLTAGANDYIVKPFSARELLVRVSSQLAVAQVTQEAHAIEEAARARLYNHFMQAPFPIGVLRGAEHALELANPIALHAWGKDSSIVGKPIIEGIPELRGQPFVGYLDEVVRTGVAYKACGELARLVRDGAITDAYFDFVYAPLRDEAGAVDGVLLAGFEVTAQVRASQELSRLLANAEASERQFREVVENLPELAWTARADGYLDYYNHRWYEYTGTTPAEMEGWGWKSVHDPSMVDAVTAQWQHSIETGEPFEMEFPLRGADGTFRWFLTRIRPLRDADGRIVRWFGSNANIDERRRNDAFRETFLGVLGHDLRNPLNTILTTTRVLTMRSDVPPEVRKRLERVSASGVRMQRMIEQLLDMTRARLAGGIPVTLSDEELPLAPVVAKIMEEARAACPHAVIELESHGDSRARIDSDRFEQVVSNLIGNALTHGDQSRPIRVTLASLPNGARFSVHNDGKPIEPAFLPLIFNPFARAEKPQARSAGLGLGLYVCERIIAGHHGTLTVTSSHDGGTLFEVLLPRRAT